MDHETETIKIVLKISKKSVAYNRIANVFTFSVSLLAARKFAEFALFSLAEAKTNLQIFALHIILEP